MSNSFNQQPQYQGLQPAIPFERPLRSSTRSRTETPVHPPQVTTRSQQHQQLTFPTPAIQPPNQQQQQQQQQQNVQQIAQQAQQLQPPQNFSHPHQVQQQAAEVPSAVYHRITPGQKPRTREQILLDTQLEAEAHNHERSPHLAHYREEQRRRHIELEKEQIEKLEKQNAYEKAQAAATMASRRSRKVRQETLNKQAAAQGQAPQQQQQQQPNTNQGQPITILDDDDGDNDVQMQEGGEGSGEDEDEDSLPEEEGPWIAPLAQPILPLRLPSVRPTLLLGPYETREECHRAAQDYAIKQGFVLVMRGCHRGKNAEGKYGPGGEVVRVDLKCDKGGTCTNRGKGLRRRKTNRLGCPAKFKLMRRISNANKWFIELICEEHNHDLDPNNMELNASYRRWKRKEEGKTGRESYKDRYALFKKQKEAVPVPEPQLHQIGLQTEVPTGPIHLAALKGQYKILEILLNNGGDLNAKDAYGRTPLHCAVEGQKMDCVTLLVDRGADVRVLNNKGVSALHMAVEKGMEDAVVMFIEKGADPNRLAFYLTPDILSLCDDLKRQRQSAAPRRGRPRKTT